MKVAINGFGRIGKLVFRAFLEKNLKGAPQGVGGIRGIGNHATGVENIHGLPDEAGLGIFGMDGKELAHSTCSRTEGTSPAREGQTPRSAP